MSNDEVTLDELLKCNDPLDRLNHYVQKSGRTDAIFSGANEIEEGYNLEWRSRDVGIVEAYYDKDCSMVEIEDSILEEINETIEEEMGYE